MKFFSIFICFLFCASVSFSQIGSKVDSIDAKVELIKSNLNNYQKLELIKNEHGYKLAYKNGNEIKMISVKSKDQEIEKNISWFYDNNVYVHCEVQWTNQDGKTLYFWKYYFDKSQLSGLKKENSLIDPASDEFKTELKSNLFSYGMELKAKL